MDLHAWVLPFCDAHEKRPCPPASQGLGLYASFLRRPALPPAVRNGAFRMILREKLIKCGVKVLRQVRYSRFQLAEVALPLKLFAAILDRILRLRAVLGVAPSS
jgi:hypothetical protein